MVIGERECRPEWYNDTVRPEDLGAKYQPTGKHMKRIKICALAVSSCLVLGALAGCNGTKETTGASSESNASVITFEETVITAAPTQDLIKPDTQEGSEPQPEIETTIQTESQPEILPKDETETQSGTQAQPAFSVDEEIELDAEGQEYVNTFITNFVEQRFYSFHKGTATIDRYLDFAYMHIKINSSDSISTVKKGDITYETFSADKAEQVIGKYFSLTTLDPDFTNVPAPPETYGDQPAGPYYENGKFYYQSAAGESVNLIGIVDTVKNYGDGTLTLLFTIYSIDLQVYEDLDSNGIKAYYKLTPEKAKANNTLTKVSSGKAVVDVGQSGAYYLISYE